MAYNYFPQNYQTPAYYPTQPQAQQGNSFQNGTSSQQIWVVGENGADSYLVAPGQTVQLWDSTAPVFYLKTADSMGRPSKRVFDYTERGIAPQKVDISPHSNYATKEDVSLIREEIDALRAKFDDMKGAKK